MGSRRGLLLVLSRSRVLGGCVELPGAGYALEVVVASGGEVDGGAEHRVSDGGGDEDFVGAGECGGSRRDVNGHAAEVFAECFTLAEMHPGTHVEFVRDQLLLDGLSASHRV